MKKLLALTIILISIVSINCSTTDVDAIAALNPDKQLAIKVDGMVCAMGCANYIEKKVANMDGVSNCTVNFEEGTAKIEFSSEITEQTEIVDLINGINDGQYKATVVETFNLKSNPASGPKGSGKEKNNEAEVSFYFPELVTYFLSNIISRS